MNQLLNLASFAVFGRHNHQAPTMPSTMRPFPAPPSLPCPDSKPASVYTQPEKFHDDESERSLPRHTAKVSIREKCLGRLKTKTKALGHQVAIKSKAFGHEAKTKWLPEVLTVIGILIFHVDRDGNPIPRTGTSTRFAACSAVTPACTC